jgi:hypothetical protein
MRDIFVAQPIQVTSQFAGCNLGNLLIFPHVFLPLLQLALVRLDRSLRKAFGGFVVEKAFNGFLSG